VDVIESKLNDDIQRYGWHVLNVLPEAGHPPHSYSIGLFATFGHPEIVVVGLAGDRAHRFINNLVDEIRDGAVFEGGCRYGHILEGHEVAFVRVDREFYSATFGRAIDYYGSASFPIVQMVWPDRNNAFPWEPACEGDIRTLQESIRPTRSIGVTPLRPNSALERTSARHARKLSCTRIERAEAAQL
jgi:hypothetical protein